MIGLFILFWVAVVSLIYIWGNKRKNFWKDHGVPHVQAPMILGNFAKAWFTMENVTEPLKRIYHHKNAKGQAFVGFNLFHKPAIMLRDPELVKRVMVKDFSDFSTRHTRGDPAIDPVGAYNLFQMGDPVIWKAMRSRLTPVFTSGKMKQWFGLVDSVGNNLNKRLQSMVEKNKEMEVRELVGYYTLDGISLVALATETNSLSSEQPTDFFVMISKTLNENFLRRLQINTIFFLSDIAKTLRIKSFSESFNETIRNLFHEVYNNRLQSGQARGDLIDALIALKKAEENDKTSLFHEDVLVAQAAVFLFAGFETSSNTISATIFALAKNPEVQRILREELKEELRKTNGKLTYESITNNLPYLNQVIKESLRLYPSLVYVDRICTTEGYSLEPFSNFRVPKGMPIYIPNYCLQTDPDHWTDPEKFDPTRFDSEKSSYNEYTYLPFGTGPRSCIGDRFGKMQVQLALTHVLRSFRVEPTPSTPQTMKLSPEAVLSRAEGGIFVKFVKDELYP